jgi:bacterioferritin-associated ferredoxin
MIDGEVTMVVCSCNVFSDTQVRAVIASAEAPRMSQVYASLGCAAQCGCCARSIKSIMDEYRQCRLTDGPRDRR